LRRLREINPSASAVVASHGDVVPEQVFGNRPDRAPPAGPHAHRHGPAPRAISLTLTEPVDWNVFGLALDRLVGTGALLRVKGLLKAAGSDRPLVVQGVRGFLHEPVFLSDWPAADDTSRIVFITDGLDEAAIRAALIPTADEGDAPDKRHGPARPGHLYQRSAAIGGPDKPGHDGKEDLHSIRKESA
jgi:G3E family GTPase